MLGWQPSGPDPIPSSYRNQMMSYNSFEEVHEHQVDQVDHVNKK